MASRASFPMAASMSAKRAVSSGSVFCFMELYFENTRSIRRCQGRAERLTEQDGGRVFYPQEFQRRTKVID